MKLNRIHRGQNKAERYADSADLPERLDEVLASGPGPAGAINLDIHAAQDALSPRKQTFCVASNISPWGCLRNWRKEVTPCVRC